MAPHFDEREDEKPEDLGRTGPPEPTWREEETAWRRALAQFVARALEEEAERQREWDRQIAYMNQLSEEEWEERLADAREHEREIGPIRDAAIAQARADREEREAEAEERERREAEREAWEEDDVAYEGDDESDS